MTPEQREYWAAEGGYFDQVRVQRMRAFGGGAEDARGRSVLGGRGGLAGGAGAWQWGVEVSLTSRREGGQAPAGHAGRG